MEFFQSFLRAFNTSEPGFVFMWALLAMALFAVLLMLERGLYLLRKSRFNAKKFMGDILRFINEGNVRGAIEKCEKSGKVILPRIICAGLKESDHGTERMQNALDEETLTQIPRLEANVGYLATIGNVSTLIGLMGTIYGLIVSFAAVGRPGIEAAQKSELLAQGISAAMNTTLTGLAIAIPCMLVYAIYSSKTQKISDTVEEYSIKLLNMLTQRSHRTHKYHIKSDHIKEGVGLHITNKNIKIFTDNKLIKEINL
ncbi:MAG: MotA/TolQ/ExbB proton channel family protein [Fibrobacteria bacterium]|nr:MotA/TolQ/ExbB proton channel family protein [Fibrobacteria bacterium]